MGGIDQTRIVLLVLAALLQACSGSSLRGEPGDGHDDVPDTAGDADASDAVNDTPWDTLPEVTGTLVPEGDGVLCLTDTGEEVHSFPRDLLPVAFSSEAYMILSSSDWDTRIGAYRLPRGGGTIETSWTGTVDGIYVPSICWSGETFLAVLAGEVPGIRLVSLLESGSLVRDPEVLAPIPDGPNMWMSGDPTEVLCPASSPFVVDFDDVDLLYDLEPDGGHDDSFTSNANLPVPSHNYEKSTCTSVGGRAACLTGSSPEARVFFFDTGSSTASLSTAFGDNVSFAHGASVAAVGEDVAVVWTDEASGDKPILGYALVGGDGGFVVPPRSTGILVEPMDVGYAMASSGSHVLVVAHAGSPFLESLPHAFLLDLAGRPVGDPVRVDPDDPGTFLGAVFWEGDAYAVLWPRMSGIVYRRFRIE